MTKIKLAVLFLLFSSINLFAKQIDAEKALLIADNFIQSSPQLRNSISKDLSLVYIQTAEKTLKNTQGQNINYYYVFNVNTNDGFIIVSGDDIATPILGYATTGSYDEQNPAPAFAYWMDCLQKEIAFAIENNHDQSSEINEQWEIYSTGNALRKATQSIGPLLKTKWGQKAPFNQKTPYQYPTGCVATAQAQIMKYYEYPSNGTGIIEAYETEEKNIPVQGIDFNNFSGYDWNNMLNDYSGEVSEVQKQAVADLMFHCGASVEMDYMPSESGAYSIAPGQSLPTFFKYDKSIQGKAREYYDDNEWDDMLLNELTNNRPVYYCGGTKVNFHAFVCDGYDGNGKYHFNWGWDGSNNGYFATSALQPNSNSYTQNQQIILNIFPDKGFEETYEMKLQSETTIDFYQDISSVKKGEPFDIQAHFVNAGVTDFTGSFGAALVYADDTKAIAEIIGMYDFLEEGQDNFFYNRTMPAGKQFVGKITIPCVVSNAISGANYLVKAAVKPENGDWTLVDGQIGFIDELLLEVLSEEVADKSKLYLYKSNKADYDKGFSVSPLKQGSPATISFAVANDGGDFMGDLELWLLDEQNNKKQLIEKGKTVIAGNLYTLFLFSSPEITVTPGNYKLALYAKAATGSQVLLPAFEENLYQNNMPVTVGEATNIENTPASSIRIYPNPVQDMIFVSQPQAGTIQRIKLVDLSGRVIKNIPTSNSPEITLDVKELATGTYFMVIDTSDGSITHKMLKK